MSKNYIHIGYYNDPLDIQLLYPLGEVTTLAADGVRKHFEDGMGNPTILTGVDRMQMPMDGDSYVQHCNNDMTYVTARYTSDKKYIVTFQHGNTDALLSNDVCHGFYIDLWEQEPEVREDAGDEDRTYDELCQRAIELTEELKALVEQIKSFKK